MSEQFFLGRNKYEVLDTLGSGATAEVYLVRNLIDKKRYAMKRGDKKLLMQESELHRSLRCPAFPKWQEYFEDEFGYLIMEYIEGITLQKWMEEKGMATEEEARGIVRDILLILQFLHSQSPPIIYRDMKPRNIMLEKDGRIRMIDLGGAVRSGYKVGTYGYAAPEQFWKGMDQTPACDIYATGKILAFLLTGKDPCIPPYDMLRFCEKDKRISTKMYEVIQRSIALNCLGRYSTAKEFDNALKSTAKKESSMKWIRHGKKEKIEYEKCVWLSEYRRESSDN